MSVLWPFALLAGSCIAVQAAMNARLGQIINNTWLATSYAFFTSFLLVFLMFLLLNTTGITIQWQQTSFSEVPWYLWFSCVLSDIGVVSMYWLIPKMGVGTLMSYALTGQLIVAMLISHFDLFESPQKFISMTKLAGSLLLIMGILLLNKD
ncbi:DMT family transporter [Colwellia sp. Arc7-635]|uniref:DMT family transporter n=1 Tax=Colwellia sp. Arc7-635 TaxID=2497879 RepID=UPI000F8560F6|nr:DMT family transporter [Colwellia sp. Arc7-635]AZQ85249.1 DMT family transporter [Colwellia sp. Arc7-635]